MEFSPGDLIAVGAVLVSAGAQLAQLAALRERTKRLEGGARAQGERLGELGTRVTVLEDRQGRRPTRSVPTIDSDDNGGTDP